MTLPPLPEAHALAVLVLTAVALALFTRDRIPLETSSVIVLVCLTVGFELFPYGEGDRALHAVDLFHGFGHEALVAVCALMVVGQGLVRTGALEPVGRSLARLWAVSPATSLLLTLVAGIGATQAGSNQNIIKVMDYLIAAERASLAATSAQ